MPRSATHYSPVTRRDLTARQKQVLELIARGKTNWEIAEELGISLDGSKWHVGEILGKLNLERREDAAAWWVHEGRLVTRARRFTTGLAGSVAGRWLTAAAATGIAVGAAFALYLAQVSDDSPNSAAGADADVTAASSATIAIAATSTGSPTPDSTEIGASRQAPFARDPDALANGRLVVYSDVVARGTKQILTFDLDTRQIVGAFEITDLPNIGVDPVRRKIFFREDDEILEADLDGSGRRALYAITADTNLIGLEVSPDGQHVAVGFAAQNDNNTRMVILEATSGQVQLDIPVSKLRALGFMGAPAPTAWKGDAVKVFGYAGKDGTLWPTALIAMDGRITIVPPNASRDYESPDGSLAVTAEGEFVISCIGGGRIFPATRIVNTATNRKLIDLGDEEHFFTIAAWSDDGHGVLLAAHGLSWRDGEPCVTAEQPPEFWAWENGSLSRVPDIQALLRRWEGEQFIETECDGVILTPDYPVAGHSITCSSGANPPLATLYLGGKPVDAVRSGAILAFIE